MASRREAPANNRLERTASLLARARREHAARLCALAPRRTRLRAAAQPERWIATTLEAERMFSTSCGIEVEKNSPSIIVESVRGFRNGILSLNHCVLPACAEALECVGS